MTGKTKSAVKQGQFLRISKSKHYKHIHTLGFFPNVNTCLGSMRKIPGAEKTFFDHLKKINELI